MTEELLINIVERLTSWGKKQKKGMKDDDKYFCEEHEETSEHEKELSYHSVYGVFPEKLILKAAPNETKEEFEYRKENYKQITKPSWDKAESFIYRIWNKQNYDIEWSNEDFEQYFTVDFPKYENYLSFFRDVVTKRKLSDPNAVLVVKPYYVPYTEVEEEGEVILVPDQSEMISPYVVIYSSKDVFMYEEGEFTLVKRKEKTVVRKDGKNVKEGYWFELYDKNTIYWIKQVGKKEDYTFEIEVYYEHGYESLPAWRLGGIPCYDEELYYYHSYFSGALPNLDLAAFMSSTMTGSIAKTAYPTRWYYEDVCGTCDGSGMVMDYDNDVSKSCSSCKGSGKSFTFSWGKDYVIKLPENQADASRFDVGNLPAPPFGTHNPGTETIEFLDAKINSLIETAFANLNIDISNAPNGQTATESKIDREEAFSFLMQISYELFELLGKSLEAMVWMRWMDGESEIKVTAPNEFTIRSSEALTNEFSTAINSGLPSPYLNKLLQESVRQRFNGDARMERIINIVVNLDPLVTKKDTEIGAMLSIGAVQKWQVVLHANIYQYIDELSAQSEDFIYGDIYTDILPKLRERAEQDVTTGTNPDDLLGGLIS